MKIKTVWCLSETSRVLNVFKCDSFLFWQTSRRTRRSRSSQRKKGQSLNPSRCSRGWATKENRARVHARTKHSRDMDTQTHARSPLRGDDRETLDQRWLEEQREVKTMQQTDEWTLSCSELPLCSHLASIIVFVSGVLSTRIFRTYMFVALWTFGTCEECCWNECTGLFKRISVTYRRPAVAAQRWSFREKKEPVCKISARFNWTSDMQTGVVVSSFIPKVCRRHWRSWMACAVYSCGTNERKVWDVRSPLRIQISNGCSFLFHFSLLLSCR